MNNTDLQPGTKEQFERCLNAALRYLSYRPRGEAELRVRLTQRGFTRETQNAVISKLAGDGLVNDAVFAQFWKDSLEYFRPSSKWAIRQELKQKGVSTEIINEVVSSIDDEANAYRAAWEKAKRLSVVDYESFCRKLGGYLQRRGFSTGVIRHALKKVWEGRKNSSDCVGETCPH